LNVEVYSSSHQNEARLPGDDYGNYGGYGGFGDDSQQESYSYWRREHRENESDGYDTQVPLRVLSWNQVSSIRVTCLVVHPKG